MNAAGTRWTAAMAATGQATADLAAAESAMAEALAAEGKGGRSSLPERKARDEKAHALEAAQAGEAALKAEYEAAALAEATETEATLRAQYEGLVAQLEAHPVLAAVANVVEAMKAFQALQIEAREVANRQGDAADKVGAEKLHHKRREVGAAGEAWAMVGKVENNNFVGNAPPVCIVTH